MCGIVGILGREAVASGLVDSLKRLDYRGYECAGEPGAGAGKPTRRRAEGKLKNLEKRLSEAPLLGKIGIGHTRWATHGAPNENNAHPHVAGDVIVVHNGIIENFQALKDQLLKDGVKFATDTDTEVVAQLIARERAHKLAPRDAVAKVLK